MSIPYGFEATFRPQEIAPQQEDFYQTQLRAMSEIVLKGAGATIGVGSAANQYYLHIPGNTPEYVSAFIWPDSTEAETAHFAVLPPQDFSHKYFGVASPATTEGDKVWVEGVDIHPTRHAAPL